MSGKNLVLEIWPKTCFWVYPGKPKLVKILNYPKIGVFVLDLQLFSTLFPNFTTIFQNFHFRAFWGHFRCQNWPKIAFFRNRHVCTHFFWISTLFPNISNNFKIFDFWGAFGAILGGQNWPKIDFFRYRHVCTHFFGDFNSISKFI